MRKNPAIQENDLENVKNSGRQQKPGNITSLTENLSDRQCQTSDSLD